MARKTRVGVIGAGSIGAFHIRSFKQCEDVEVAAVADIRGERAEKAAAEHGIPNWFEDYRDLLRMADVDAVSVCLPNCLHAPVSCAALNAGKHVLCEKPPGMSAAEVRRMKRTAAAARKALMFAFCMRFGTAVQELKRQMDKGILGDVYYVRIAYLRRRGVPGRGGWFTRKEMSGGGPLIDIGVHWLDTTLYLLGFPEPTLATGATYSRIGPREPYVCLGMWGTPEAGGKVDVEDLAVAQVRLANGTTINIESSWALNGPEISQTALFGDKAGASISQGKVTIYGETNGQLSDTELLSRPGDQYLAEAEHFIECVRTNKKPISNVDQALVVQRIVDAIYRSAETGKQVRVR